MSENPSPLREWDETNGVSFSLLDFDHRDDLLWDEQEKNVVLRATQAGKSNIEIGANADIGDIERQAFLESRGYDCLFSMVDMNCLLTERFNDPTCIAGLDNNLAEELWHLNNEAYEGREYIPVVDDDDFQEFLHDIMSECSICATEFVDESLAGFAWGLARQSSLRIMEVSVLPRYRRQGIARKLLFSVLSQAHLRGINMAELETNGEDIVGARSLYESLGFVVTATHLRYRKSI